jgi:hypothetical protein
MNTSLLRFSFDGGSERWIIVTLIGPLSIPNLAVTIYRRVAPKLFVPKGLFVQATA